MLTHDRMFALFRVRKHIPSMRQQPKDILHYIANINRNNHAEINQALRLAASGIQTDMDILVDMVRAKPHLLLQAIELEKLGQKEQALEFYMQLVAGNPSCKACRYHMGRVAGELIRGGTSHSINI